MTRTLAALTVLGTMVMTTALTTTAAHAQGPWTLEIRAGGNTATDTFAASDLGTGAGFEGSIGYRIAPGLSLFGGWNWQHRRAIDALFGVEAEVEDTGYVYGLYYVVPGRARAKPFVRVAGLWNHVEIEDAGGELVADSKHARGLELGGGLDVALGGAWSLTPGIRYRRFEPTVRFGGTESAETLSYVTFDVGIAWRF